MRQYLVLEITRFTSSVPGFQSRSYWRNTVSATASKRVSSGRAGAASPRLMAASMPPARERASSMPMASKSLTIFQTRLPRC